MKKEEIIMSAGTADKTIKRPATAKVVGKKAEPSVAPSEGSETEIEEERQPRRRTLPHLFNSSPSIFDSLGEDSGLDTFVFPTLHHQDEVSRDLSMSPFSRIRNDLEQFVEETDKEIEARFLSPNSPRITFSQKEMYRTTTMVSIPTSPLVGPSVMSEVPVLVGNLLEGTSEAELREAFREVNSILSIDLQSEQAIVKFGSIEAASEAIIKMEGVHVGQRAITASLPTIPRSVLRRSSTGSMNLGPIGLPNPSRMSTRLPGDPPNARNSLASNGEALRQIFASISLANQEVVDVYRPSVTAQYDLVIPELPPTYFGPELTPARIRDYRRHIENPTCKPSDFDLIAMEVLPVVISASTDPIGNVLVQKLIERGSEELKSMIIAELEPYLAAIGVHKNGTWVVQKLINWCTLPHHQLQVGAALSPYLVPLMQDQFGNYVVQCCLQFGEGRNQFIIDGLQQQCLVVGTSRFGARSMRSCLESIHVTGKQQKQVATSIIANAGRLILDPNGVIVMQWLLDSDLPGRFQSLLPALQPTVFTALVGLRFASNLLSKLLSQSAEPEIRDQMLAWLFKNSEAPSSPMQALLKEPTCLSVIGKVMSALPTIQRKDFVEACKRAVAVVSGSNAPAHLLKLEAELKDVSHDYSAMIIRLQADNPISNGTSSPQASKQPSKGRLSLSSIQEHPTIIFGNGHQISNGPNSHPARPS